MSKLYFDTSLYHEFTQTVAKTKQTKKYLDLRNYLKLRKRNIYLQVH